MDFEDDFDSLLWDNDDNDKDAQTAPFEEVEINTGNSQSQGDDDGNQNQSNIPLHPHNNESTQSTINSTPTTQLNNSQSTFISLQQPANNLNQPFLNTFISAMADQSSSQYQSTQSNIENPNSGLPLFFTPSGVLNQDNNCSLADGSTAFKAQGTNQQMLSFQSYQQLEPIFPPNFFLSGLPLWDPSQATCATNNNDSNFNAPQSSQFKAQPPIVYKNEDPCNKNTGLDNLKTQMAGVSVPALHGFQSLPQSDCQQFDNDKWDHVQVCKHIAMLQQVKQSHGEDQVAQLSSSTQNNDVMQPIVPGQAPMVPQIQPQANPISDNDSNSTRDLKQKSTSSNSNNKKNKKSKQTKGMDSGDTSKTLPPFYLFDAPVELRHNFIQAQRAMNIPPLKDSNTVHYNLASKRFDNINQLCNNDMINATLPSVGSTSNGDLISPDGNKVDLLDARLKKTKKGNERNEREQQRAAKITELIDKLRTTMVQGGWKVEMKSKYQTLST